ncbi:MAG: hypothetical protein WAT39_13340 [Planctomycetota bacterium]
MNEQRRSVRVFLDDGHPEANDYDDNYLVVGIDPVLHPDWRGRRDPLARMLSRRPAGEHACPNPGDCSCPHAA